MYQSSLPTILTEFEQITLEAQVSYKASTEKDINRLLNSDKLRPVSAGLGNFSSMFKTDYTGLFAASSIATVPVLIIFLIFQRYFIEALAGSLKG